MQGHIHAIGTAVPAHGYDQAYALQRMQGWLGDRRWARLAAGVYHHSGIHRRHSVLPDFVPGSSPRLFREQADGRLAEPGTGARNRVYEEEAPGLALAAARRALAAAGAGPASITHLITASCTGFANPGPDLRLIQGLGLNPSVERYHLGFMGCYAAFPALRLADHLCRSDPEAGVLVVCVELCSLHLQVQPRSDSLLANAIFADGAAAAVVRAPPPPADRPRFALSGFGTCILPEGESEMAWTVGDRGFDMILGGGIPSLLAERGPDALGDLLASVGLGAGDLGGWAIHPGGRAILDALGRSLGLPEAALAVSRGVLRDFGNMSSATILFVLERMMRTPAREGAGPVAALAFGPGLTVEFALLHPLGVRPPAPIRSGRA